MLSKFSVKKPLTIFVAVLIVAILGVVAFLNMSVDLLPNMNFPYAIVVTTYPGATSEEVEENVTRVLEQSLATMPNLDEVSSTSSENFSMIVLKFSDSTNMDSAMLQIRENIDLSKPKFPSGVASSNIIKINPSMLPIMSLSVSLKNKTALESSKYVNDIIMPKLVGLEGVATVNSNGIISNMVDIAIDGAKLETWLDQLVLGQTTLRDVLKLIVVDAVSNKTALDVVYEYITADNITNLLKGQDINFPAGSVIHAGESVVIKVGDGITGVNELENLLIFDFAQGGFKLATLRLKDFTTITKIQSNEKSYTKTNGQDSIMLSINKEPDVSTAEVSKVLLAKLNELKTENPDLEYTILLDQGDYTNSMINAVISNMLWGALLAVVVLFVFLKQLKPTFTVGLSIVISVIATFVLMYFANIKLNIISMGGLALGIGMLVDNSIVVIDNIYRMRKNGVGAKEAAVYGAKQVAGAIIASTITTVVVFLPILFIEGLAKTLFMDMALTIGFSLLASLVVALTVVPAMASLEGKKAKIPEEGKIFKSLKSAYSKALDFSLNKKWVVLTVAVSLFVFTVVGAFTFVPTELFPKTDMGSISITLTPNGDLTQTDKFKMYDDFYNLVKDVKDVDYIGISSSSGGAMASMSSGASDSASVNILLNAKRKKSTAVIGQEIKDIVESNGLDCTIKVETESMDMSAVMSSGIEIKLYSNDNAKLREYGDKISSILNNHEGVTEVNGVDKGQKELKITVNKDESMKHGIPAAMVYASVAKAIAAPKVIMTVVEDEINNDIIVKDTRNLPPTQLNEFLADGTTPNTNYIGNLVIGVDMLSGNPVLLKDVSTINMGIGSATVKHINQKRYVTVSAKTDTAFNVNALTVSIMNEVNKIELPEGMTLEVGGEMDSFNSMAGDMILVLCLAIVLIYLVMVAQFQSLKSPFIIMFTIPLAFTGAMIAIMISGQALSMVSLIGIIVLVGVVVNNGIVFVDYTNKMMEDEGMTKREALIRTGQDRIRPILMTALTTIFALIVMMFDNSASGAMLKPLAVASVGGLLYATLLTLFVVPIIYDLFNRKNTREKIVIKNLDEIDN